MNLPRSVNTCIDTLNNKGFEAFLVGGAPRNYILHLVVTDYDITTSALPNEIKDCFKTYTTIDTGIEHGTVTVIIEDTSIEITTYRTEKEYINHRHPKHVEFTTSLEEDCKRRDFTMNALCYHPTYGMTDFFNGLSDIQNKTIRCIGNPKERFNEDALRILRAVRFSAQLGFLIEPFTNLSLFECKDYLKSISSERLQDELFKILLSAHCANRCCEYAELFEVFIPELHVLNLYPKKKNNTYASLSRSHESIHIRFALLIHQCDDTDLLTTARRIMNRLKFSNYNKTAVLQLLSSLSFDFSSKVAIKLYLQSCKIDFLTIIDFKTAVDPKFDSELAKINYTTIIQNGECYSLSQLAINGKDLLALEIESKLFSSILQRCLHAVITEVVTNEKNSLINYSVSYNLKNHSLK